VLDCCCPLINRRSGCNRLQKTCSCLQKLARQAVRRTASVVSKNDKTLGLSAASCAARKPRYRIGCIARKPRGAGLAVSRRGLVKTRASPESLPSQPWEPALNETAPSQQWGRRTAAPSTAAGSAALNKTAPSQPWGRRTAPSRTAAGSVVLNKTAPSQSAEGATDRCVAHGGGNRCAEQNCTKSARGATDRCAKHGGGKRCAEQNCTKSAV
jgi:hypothetical protein